MIRYIFTRGESNFTSGIERECQAEYWQLTMEGKQSVTLTQILSTMKSKEGTEYEKGINEPLQEGKRPCTWALIISALLIKEYDVAILSPSFRSSFPKEDHPHERNKRERQGEGVWGRKREARWQGEKVMKPQNQIFSASRIPNINRRGMKLCYVMMKETPWPSKSAVSAQNTLIAYSFLSPSRGFLCLFSSSQLNFHLKIALSLFQWTSLCLKRVEEGTGPGVWWQRSDHHCLSSAEAVPTETTQGRPLAARKRVS